MNSIDVRMCENRGYIVFSHSYTPRVVDLTMVLVRGAEGINVDNDA